MWGCGFVASVRRLARRKSAQTVGAEERRRHGRCSVKGQSRREHGTWQRASFSSASMASQPAPDFLAQEPLILGRNARESRPTARQHYYAQMREKQNASLNARHQRRDAQAQQALTQQVPALQAEPNPVNVHPAQEMHGMSAEHLDSFAVATFDFSTLNTGLIGFGKDISGHDVDHEEQCETQDNPDADQEELTEFQKRLVADESLLDDFLARPSQITSTPVALPTPRRVRQPPRLATPCAAPPTPLPGQPRPRHLIHRTHLLPPLTPSLSPIRPMSHDKENFAPVAAQPTRQMETSIRSQPGSKRRRDDDGGSSPDGPPDYHPKDDESDEDNLTGSPSKLRAGDLNPARRRIFDGALPHYFMELSKYGPYPSPTEEDAWAAKSWFDSLNKLIATGGYAAGNAAPTQGEIELIKARLHNFRGSVRDKARELVVPQYGFLHGGEVASINHNRQLVEELLHHNSFIYRDPSNRAERESIFRNAIIRNVIHQVWFGDKGKSLALLYPDSFVDVIPLETIAFVITAIHCAITEFSLGVQTNMKFDTKIYQPAYLQHLKSLCDWHAFTEARGSHSTRNLQSQLLLSGREFAGAGVHTTTQEVYRLPSIDTLRFYLRSIAHAALLRAVIP
ncbi:hypothetical protein LshimejAT787_2200520 [Lyophyllum shimeji]|uniref:DUF6532 domain-containing protein n=1 Tax=Lyophyllum shimeji TaxID=47721 RepID=A0A9P3Q1K3_LYOSH|nr:hypothetical protein LshimejAT787_2200520 [Lyophyllum shimeji]